MIGYLILGVMVGLFLGANLGVLLVGVLNAAKDRPLEMDPYR